MKHKSAVIVLISLAILAGKVTFSQEWVVPDDARARVCPYQFTPDSVKKGEAVFTKNCQSCHGYPGKNNVAKINPLPKDPATKEFQVQTDGEMFYRITTGRAPMPEFGKILTETDRWNVIAFLRSFNPAYVQPAPAKAEAFKGRFVKLSMQADEKEYKIRVTAVEITKEKKELPAQGVEVALFAKRYFGDLQVGDSKTTNARGIASFDFSKDLPGDRNGLVMIMARANSESGKINDARVTDTVNMGVPTLKPGLTEARAWWNVRSKAPVWIIIVYCGSVLTVWSLIIYVLYLISGMRKIKN